jgi:hypothetical protein
MESNLKTLKYDSEGSVREKLEILRKGRDSRKLHNVCSRLQISAKASPKAFRL